MRPTRSFDECAMMSLICGGVSIFAICLWYVVLPVGALGIILGIVGFNSKKRPIAIIGIILNAFAVAFTLLVTASLMGSS